MIFNTKHKAKTLKALVSFVHENEIKAKEPVVINNLCPHMILMNVFEEMVADNHKCATVATFNVGYSLEIHSRLKFMWN
jgi:hypothetical protein